MSLKGTCHDCRERFDLDTMHVIKASTLSGRARICDPCHLAEVASVTEFNKSIQAKRKEQTGEQHQ